MVAERVLIRLDSADVWLTVPAAWDAKGCELMREAAISAGLVQQFAAHDRDWESRLHIITYGFSKSCHRQYLNLLCAANPKQLLYTALI